MMAQFIQSSIVKVRVRYASIVFGLNFLYLLAIPIYLFALLKDPRLPFFQSKSLDLAAELRRSA